MRFIIICLFLVGCAPCKPRPEPDCSGANQEEMREFLIECSMRTENKAYLNGKYPCEYKAERIFCKKRRLQ
jgi:hypothetical protein